MSYHSVEFRSGMFLLSCTINKKTWYWLLTAQSRNLAKVVQGREEKVLSLE